MLEKPERDGAKELQARLASYAVGLGVCHRATESPRVPPDSAIRERCPARRTTGMTPWCPEESSRSVYPCGGQIFPRNALPERECLPGARGALATEAGTRSDDSRDRCGTGRARSSWIGSDWLPRPSEHRPCEFYRFRVARTPAPAAHAAASAAEQGEYRRLHPKIVCPCQPFRSALSSARSLQ